VSVERATGAAPEFHVCTECRNYRFKAAIHLFDPTDLQSPGALAAQNKWDEEQRQRAKEEQQRYVAQQPFESEPHHYAWCAAYTMIDDVEKARAGDENAKATLMKSGGALFNPVTGEISPLYILCAWMNPEGRCERYEPKS
jgi:hypothetical protein